MGLKTPIILRLSVFVDFNLWVHSPYHMCHWAWVRGFCRLKNQKVCSKAASYWSLQIRTIDHEFLKIHGSIAMLWMRWMVVKTTKPQHKQYFPNATWWSHVELGPTCELGLEYDVPGLFWGDQVDGLAAISTWGARLQPTGLFWTTSRVFPTISRPFFRPFPRFHRNRNKGEKRVHTVLLSR